MSDKYNIGLIVTKKKLTSQITFKLLEQKFRYDFHFPILVFQRYKALPVLVTLHNVRKYHGLIPWGWPSMREAKSS